MSKQPIGIFDSGVGGTSIWKEIQSLLPNESSIYLADSKNAPYGPKGKDTIIELSIKNLIKNRDRLAQEIQLLKAELKQKMEKSLLELNHLLT